MDILVLGGDGYVGSRIVKEFNQKLYYAKQASFYANNQFRRVSSTAVDDIRSSYYDSEHQYNFNGDCWQHIDMCYCCATECGAYSNKVTSNIRNLV